MPTSDASRARVAAYTWSASGVRPHRCSAGTPRTSGLHSGGVRAISPVHTWSSPGSGATEKTGRPGTGSSSGASPTLTRSMVWAASSVSGSQSGQPSASQRKEVPSHFTKQSSGG